MVRLHAANRHQRIGVRLDRIGDDVFELAQLVATHGQSGIAIIALGVDLDFAADRVGQPWQVLDRRGAEGERVAFEFVEPKHVVLRRRSLVTEKP